MIKMINILLALLAITKPLSAEKLSESKDPVSKEELNYMVGIYLQDLIKDVSSDCKDDLEKYVQHLNNKASPPVDPSVCIINSIKNKHPK